MNALIESSETTNDPKIKSESIPFYEHEMNFEFVLSIIIWYDILLNVDTVSKSLQIPKTDLKKIIFDLNKYGTRMLR